MISFTNIGSVNLVWHELLCQRNYDIAISVLCITCKELKDSCFVYITMISYSVSRF